MSKKAAIELQFNWIFVIIAGALIILFFVSIVTKQKQASDNKISSTILIDLESILTGAKVSTGTIHKVSIPKREISFECNKYSAGRISMDIKNKIIFSPDLIKGRNLITWALDWNVPFWITNFLYLTTEEVRYIFVYDDSFGNKIFNDWLPEEINKEHIESGDVFDKNNYRVKFVFINQDPIALTDSMLSGLKKMSDEHVKAIRIEKDGDTENTGTITFYEKDGDTWKEEVTGESSAPYLKKESLIAAIFAADLENYECSMEKAFTKLKMIAAIYENRSTELETDYGGTPCSSPHSVAIEELDNIIESGLDQASSIYGSIKVLEHQNGVAQLRSCVLIY